MAVRPFSAFRRLKAAGPTIIYGFQGAGAGMTNILETASDMRAWLANSHVRRARLKRLRQLRWRHRLMRLARAVTAAGAIFLAALIAGFFMDGIGTEGLLVTFFAMGVAFLVLASFPRMRSPSASELRTTNLRELTGRTEAWLEAQRALLPTKMQGQVDRIGVGLEQLANQMTTLNERGPAAYEVRNLLGEQLPALVETYTRIPSALRGRPNGGSTPEAQLSKGLEIIAREIDTLTGQIARGELDELAIRGRYLETRYPQPGGE